MAWFAELVHIKFLMVNQILALQFIYLKYDMLQNYDYQPVKTAFRLGLISAPDISARDISARDISARDISAQTFHHGEFLPQEHFGMGIFWHHGCFGMGMLRHWNKDMDMSILLCKVPKCTCAETSMCQNILVPKCPCAITSMCRNLHDAKKSP